MQIKETETINAVYSESPNYVRTEYCDLFGADEDDVNEVLQGADKGLADDMVEVVFKAPGCLID